ncbi:Flagellar M-ring protein [Myxococcaceae bacterium]|jgi:flagellar biosynthesis/type III secretory pathway M-ring protein FliF/YscJ|nr:Flagellar M-ring protein [Myxococcaceae bacterium]
MTVRTRREELAAAWRAWPPWRRRLLVASVLVSSGCALWLTATQVARDGGAIGAALVSSAPPPDPAPSTHTGVPERDDARQAALEAALGTKAEVVLERVLGSGRAVVEVRADLDWNARESSEERFDAKGQIERREERTTEPGAGKIGARTTEIVEYEIPKQVVREKTPAGELRRLHVALLVDANEIRALGLGDAELAALEDLVRQAVGFSAERGDILSVARIPFRSAGALGGIENPGIEALIVVGLAALAVVLVAIALRRREIELGEASLLPMTAADLEASLVAAGAGRIETTLPDDLAASLLPGHDRDAAAAALRAWLEDR